MAAALQNADENTMFSTVELVKRIPDDRLAAGKPGVWLEQAAVLNSWCPDLRAKMDRVAVRLMNAEDNSGYLGALAPARMYTAHDIAAHANNLRGLLAYYAITKQPAALYAAIRAGNFLIDNYDPWPGHEEPGAENSLVYTLARLYQASGESKYLQFAEREEATRGCDGLGLCALYEATGNSRYLSEAAKTWSYSRSTHNESTTVKAGLTAHVHPIVNHNAGPQFSAELFTLTGNPKYLAGLADYRTTSVWPVAVAYTHGNTGLSVNCLYPATIHVGSIHLDVASSLRPVTVGEISTSEDTSTRLRRVDLEDAAPPRKGHDQPAQVETDVIAVTTSAHTAPLVHIALQPGCVASTASVPVELSINGKRVNVEGLSGAHLALRPTDSNIAKKSAPPRRRITHPAGTTDLLTPEA
jgi:hypothetical protein